MTSDKTLEKADAALEIILKFDSKNNDVSFRQVLDQILLKWKELD